MASIYRGGAIIGTPRLITSGLQVYLDARVPISYPGTGTSWYDLSGNNRTFTLTNGVTYNGNGYLSFIANSSQYAINSSVNFTGITNWTLMAAVYRVGNQPNETKVISLIGGSTTGLGVSTQGSSNNNQVQYEWNGADFNQLTNLVIPASKWSIIAITVTPSLVNVYLNFSYYSKNVIYTTPNINSIIIGGSNGGRYFNGGIGAALIYTRALSIDEIFKNIKSLGQSFNI
jgi:hypothetical protein